MSTGPSQPTGRPQADDVPGDLPPAAAPAGATIISRPPLVRIGLRGFLDLGRKDLLALFLLVGGSLFLRLASPIFITALDHPFSGPTVVMKGLGYPWNGGEYTPGSPAGSADGCGAANAGGLPVDPSTGRLVNPAPNPDGTYQPDSNIQVCGFIFDEIYFPPDALKDLHQPAISYFDPEPPLTKILMTPAIKVFGFTTWGWRFTQALFGSLLVGMIYLIARRLRRDRFFAVAAGMIISLDGLAFVESRIGVIDIIAIFFVALTYYLFLLHWQARTPTQWRVTLYALAGAVGLAFGAKVTALAPVAVIASLVAMRFLEGPLLDRDLWHRALSGVGSYVVGALVVAIAAALVVLLHIPPWALVPAVGVAALLVLARFALRPLLRLVGGLNQLSGPRAHEACMWREAAGRRAALHYAAAVVVVGMVFVACWSRYLTVSHTDVYQFVGCSLKSGLVSNADNPVAPGVVPPSIHDQGLVGAGRQVIYDIWADFKAGLDYHAAECHSHPYQSRWFSWPLDVRPVLFFYDESLPAPDGSAGISSISNMGNPAVWWLGIPALLFCAWRMTRGPLWWRIGLPLLGIAAVTVMVFSFATSIHYVDPKNSDIVYSSAADFQRATGSDPADSPSLEVAAVDPGPWFLAGLGGLGVFTALGIASAVVSRRFVPALIVVSWTTAWVVPWVIGNEKRVLFFYHALGILLFATLALAYALAALRHSQLNLGSRTLRLAPLSYAILGTVVVAFIFFYPMWTAMPLPKPDHAMRVWLHW